ncbi:MAG: FixH family protein [Myxococcaceae bacterium]
MVANRFFRSLSLVFASGLAVACGSSASIQQGFGSTPLVTVTSASGALQLAVFTNPQPPTDGDVAVRYVITDVASSQLVDGLSLAIVPWMPAMGHGTSVVPSVSAAGGGVYNLTNVYLFMPGQWQLRTAITGGATDSAAPDLMVQ